MKWIISALIGVGFIAAVNFWNHPGTDRKHHSPAYYRVTEFDDDMSRKDFKRRLKYHGLHKQISVVTCDGRSCWYRNAAGERCTF